MYGARKEVQIGGAGLFLACMENHGGRKSLNDS